MAYAASARLMPVGACKSAACVTACADGMVVDTHSEAVQRSRRTILELLASTVDLAEAPEILALLAEYGADQRTLWRGREAHHAYLR